jgi:hypothetical protein
MSLPREGAQRLRSWGLVRKRGDAGRQARLERFEQGGLDTCLIRGTLQAITAGDCTAFTSGHNYTLTIILCQEKPDKGLRAAAPAGPGCFEGWRSVAPAFYALGACLAGPTFLTT